MPRPSPHVPPIRRCPSTCASPPGPTRTASPASCWHSTEPRYCRRPAQQPRQQRCRLPADGRARCNALHLLVHEMVTRSRLYTSDQYNVNTAARMEGWALDRASKFGWPPAVSGRAPELTGMKQKRVLLPLGYKITGRGARARRGGRGGVPLFAAGSFAFGGLARGGGAERKEMTHAGGGRGHQSGSRVPGAGQKRSKVSKGNTRGRPAGLARQHQGAAADGRLRGLRNPPARQPKRRDGVATWGPVHAP